MIPSALVDGNSVIATARLCGASRVTILRLLADAGTVCERLQNELVRADGTGRPGSAQQGIRKVPCRGEIEPVVRNGHGPQVLGEQVIVLSLRRSPEREAADFQR